MTEQISEEENNYDGLLGNYLKAQNLTKKKETFACTGVKKEKGFNNGDEQLVLELSSNKGKQKWQFGMNKTNTKYMLNKLGEKPNDVIGKKITLEKISVYSPSAKAQVDGLRICGIQ